MPQGFLDSKSFSWLKLVLLNLIGFIFACYFLYFLFGEKGCVIAILGQLMLLADGPYIRLFGHDKFRRWQLMLFSFLGFFLNCCIMYLLFGRIGIPLAIFGRLIIIADDDNVRLFGLDKFDLGILFAGCVSYLLLDENVVLVTIVGGLIVLFVNLFRGFGRDKKA